MTRLKSCGRRGRAAALFALLGACAALTIPDIETTRTYPEANSERLYEQTLAALRASGFELTETDRDSGVIAAVSRFDERDWAECTQPRVLAQTEGDRQEVVAARESHRRVELRASVEDTPEGARLTLDPTFTAEPVRPGATAEECATTGELEREILDTVAEQSA